jgi:hypothetical protein
VVCSTLLYLSFACLPTHFKHTQIVIDGQTHNKDVIIFPNRVFGGWRRGEGHLLQPDDLADVFAARPKVLVVGQGAYGRMAIAPETEEALQAANIELIALPTEQACQTYNNLREQEGTVAALHLTC